MTFNQILVDAKSRTAYPDGTLDVAWKNWINLAQQNICVRYLWPFLITEQTITTVNGTETYALNSDTLGIVDVRDTTNNRRLKYVDIAEFFSSVPNPTATGTPYLYRLPGNTQATSGSVPTPQISFYSIPGGAYTIKIPYFQQLPDLVKDGDISRIPSQFHELLVNYAVAKYFFREGDPRTVTANDAYESMLMDMVSQLNAQPVDRIHVLGSLDDVIRPALVRFPPSFGFIRSL